MMGPEMMVQRKVLRFRMARESVILPSRMVGDELTTQVLVTLDFLLQFLGRCLKWRDIEPT